MHNENPKLLFELLTKNPFKNAEYLHFRAGR